MSSQNISLSGSDWKVMPLMPREWEWRKVWETAENLLPPLWIASTVPGTVQDDARDAGLTPDYAYDFNSRACEWTSERDWAYLKMFETPELPADGVARLVFEGVDWACDVYLNGTHLGRHEGMYDAFEYDVTGLLASEGPNRLVVVCEHAPREEGQIGYTSRVKIWKARFAYNWDWCTRLVPIGIWDDVTLKLSGPAWVRRTQVDPVLSEDLSSAVVGVSVELGSKAAAPVTVKAQVSFEGAVVGEAEAKVMAVGESTAAALTVDIADAKLWWPNGYGEQDLYQVQVCICDAEGEGLDGDATEFGLRRVRHVACDGAPADALAYVLEVNGVKVWSKGWNWVPIQQLYGRTPYELYERWLGLAAGANCNLLRVWGGGLLEKEHFYQLCDRLGIMVWQEFIQSSSGIDNKPSTDPEYLAYIQGQAELMVPRRHNHPSLVLWCGGNELMTDDWTPLGDTHPALAVLKDCVRRLDPERLWLPTSASGPAAGADLAKVGGMHDVHGPWQYGGPEGHYTLYNGIDPLLHAEFGVEGAANLCTMHKCNTPELLWPPDETNPLWMHRGQWWIQKATMGTAFGEIDSLETWVAASQFLQAEGLRYAVEANRRRKWRCAGTSPWQFNELWPNLSCTNVVDFYGLPRPAYWWCGRAYELLHASAKYDKLSWQAGETFTAEVWLNNSLDAAPGCVVGWEISDLAGSVLASGEVTLDAAATSATKAAEIAWPVSEVAGSVFVLRVWACAGERKGAPNHYVFGTAGEPVYAPLLSLPQTTVELARDGEAVTMTNTGAAWAFGVSLASEGWLDLSDDYLLLKPGESVTVRCAPADAAVMVRGMNVG